MSADDIDPLYEIRIRYKEYFDKRFRGSYQQELLDEVFAAENEDA